jgi:hypothetical protein
MDALTAFATRTKFPISTLGTGIYPFRLLSYRSALVSFAAVILLCFAKEIFVKPSVFASDSEFPLP